MRYCAQPGCSVIVDRGSCERHRSKEGDRPNVDVRRLYRTPRWLMLRQLVLTQEGVCPGRDDGRACGARTTDVDHITPHRGDPILFWSRANLRALCHACHSSKTGRGL